MEFRVPGEVAEMFQTGHRVLVNLQWHRIAEHKVMIFPNGYNEMVWEPHHIAE